MSDSLQLPELQCTGLPCPLLSPEVWSNSCLVSWWHSTTSSSVALLSFYPQPFTATGSFPMTLFFSALQIKWPKYWNFSISPSNEYSGLISFRIDWLDLLAVQGLSRVFSSSIIWKNQFLHASTFFMVQLSHLYVTTGKTIALTIQTFVGKVMSLLFNTLSRFVIVFLPSSKCKWLEIY